MHYDKLLPEHKPHLIVNKLLPAFQLYAHVCDHAKDNTYCEIGRLVSPYPCGSDQVA